MIDVKSIFAFKKINVEKLISFGFVDYGKCYKIKKAILDNQFYISVTVTQSCKVDYSVMDVSINEEYTLVKTSNAQGAFVGTIRTECEDFLREISDNCFDVDVFHSDQTNRVIPFMANKYDADAEFLWEKHPNYAVFRRQNNDKWFAIIMTIDGKKINPSLDKVVEIIDLKGTAEHVASLVDDQTYYKGYHMNKKYWYTIILNDSVSDRELFDRIATSFELTK